ncbi:anionic trypsin-2-like [Dicentrarchus labrax]|uniref:Peptidase S1 domain-containing protein n=1 Tax=Dicentrarchus labrax TaxID=13489 RepID=A0A8C4GGT4_DICLA|nr:anionic trypsin-2-like [Dicentrarchus labrax]
MGGMASLLLLLWVGLTVGKVVDLQKRIIGGHNCNNNERLYHVKLIAKVDATHESLCGGSLISDQWILTAAHCWEPRWIITAHLGVHPRQGHGNAQQMQITEDPQIFTDQDNNNNVRQHDIMLLKLPRKVTIRPVQLPDCKRRPNVGATVQIAGHAARFEVPPYVPDLQCADIKVVTCPHIVVNNVDWSYQHWLCGRTRGVDTCPGDSGGGVVYNNKIYGVHSNSGTYACTAEAAFMDVCEYIQWIRIVTGLN